MSDTPRTDTAYFKPGTTLYDLAGEMKRMERELATANARADRAESRLREFCAKNPTRWTRLELMDLRDQLREALEAALEHIPTTLQGEAKEAIAAAKEHEAKNESGHRAGEV